jgi:hypothetical protein
MSLLARASYDPAVAVSAATTALQAMTALDATNLAVTFTAPANGVVMVRLKGQTSGATTFPRILLGVLDGGTLKGRGAPVGMIPTGVAAASMGQETCFLVTGLTPGSSYTWKMAMGVEIVLASTGFKYGGPDDATGADAWGACVFEVWSTENLLAGTFYDPGTAATLATTSLLAMTAMDTTNLRLTFTAPASGNVMWRIHSQQHGSTTFGQTLLGVMESTTVVARQAPTVSNPQTAVVTACVGLEASGVITGVSAGSHTYDAAYAVQVIAGAGGIKHGGPDDATTNNAFGGTAFELWAA